MTPRYRIAVHTGGGDRPYALGFAYSLLAQGIQLDFIGSDFLECAILRSDLRVNFLNLRGDMSPAASLPRKVARVLKFYVRLLRYAASTEARVFHVLWNNKLELFDRTLLFAYYRALGKKVFLTVHNVNIRHRDGMDSLLNRLTLRIQYHLAHHLFVHTEKMEAELIRSFNVPAHRISVIPFGINNTVPITSMTREQARERLQLRESCPTLLFFGNILPYKGLEHLIEALSLLLNCQPKCRLIIAGRPKGAESYWAQIEQKIEILGLQRHVMTRIEYIPDEDTEIYFKAADAIVLPYVKIFQSGVLLLAYNFGLPVIASDIASLPADVVEGETGFLCAPGNPQALAAAIGAYLTSDLYAELEKSRSRIRRFAEERYSWRTVARITTEVYESVL
jgi:D-inositol-3-phosphate glycosyltransferase